MGTVDDRERLVLFALLLQSREVTDSMREALKAAAELLQKCTCHNARSPKSRAACDLANKALDRLDLLDATILKQFPDGREVIQ
jgi:hypothetical protein